MQLGKSYLSSLNLLRLNCWAGVLAKLLRMGVRFLVCLCLATGFFNLVTAQF